MRIWYGILIRALGATKGKTEHVYSIRGCELNSVRQVRHTLVKSRIQQFGLWV